MAEPRIGRQTPTQSVVLPYFETKGQEAIDLYNETGRMKNDGAKMEYRSTSKTNRG